MTSNMAYEEHPDFPAPPDDTIIWRYMDFPKLLSLLEQRALYFALLSEMPDVWEGVLPRSLLTTIASQTSPSASGQIVSLYELARRLHTVNCWHENASESIAMWSLYTQAPYGTAIRSTVGRLKRAVATAPQRMVAFSRVKYRDYEIQESNHGWSTKNTLDPVFSKRRCFEHERELRAIAPWPVVDFADKPVGFTEVVSYAQQGQLFPVELQELIEGVVLGPQFPSWAQSLLSKAIDRAAITPWVRNSDIYKSPPPS